MPSIPSTNKTDHQDTCGLVLWCLMPLSTVFQLYYGGQFYWWRTNWSTRRKPLTCRKSLTKLYHMNIRLSVFNATFNNISVICTCIWRHRCCDRMVIGYTTTCAISAYHHWRCEFESHSWWDVLNTTLCDKVLSVTCDRSVVFSWYSSFSSTSKTDPSSVVIGTDCTGSCISNYHSITTTMAPDTCAYNRNIVESGIKNR
jgi:hypothetical protein